MIRRLKADCTILTTGARLEAIEMARQAVKDGYSRVVSVGGDGTMNEVASGLIRTDVALGLVPLGSGNGLARDLGLPMDFERSVEVALTGGIRTIDSGCVNGQAFFNVMGFGYDAELGLRFNASKHRGFLNYFKIGVTVYFQYRRQTYQVEVGDGESVAFKAYLVAVANSTQYGGGVRIAPQANLQDGLLNMVAITSSNPIWIPSMLFRMFAGTIDRSPKAISLLSDRFLVRRGAPGPVHTDGEVHDMDRKLHVEVLPDSLKVVVPDDSVR